MVLRRGGKKKKRPLRSSECNLCKFPSLMRDRRRCRRGAWTPPAGEKKKNNKKKRNTCTQSEKGLRVLGVSRKKSSSRLSRSSIVPPQTNAPSTLAHCHADGRRMRGTTHVLTPTPTHKRHRMQSRRADRMTPGIAAPPRRASPSFFPAGAPTNERGSLRSSEDTRYGKDFGNSSVGKLQQKICETPRRKKKRKKEEEEERGWNNTTFWEN
ncbi:unnamed protein product [Ophioblennius macclurei]